MTTVTIQIEGGEVLLAMARRSKQSVSMRSLKPGFEAFMLELEEAIFLTEGGRRPWAKLSTGYAAIKELRWPGKSILIASGDMHRGLTQTGGKNISRRRGLSSYEFGVRNTPAPFHDRGNPNLPKREPIILTQQEGRGIARLIGETISAHHAKRNRSSKIAGLPNLARRLARNPRVKGRA